jgi:hypothetical protein
MYTYTLPDNALDVRSLTSYIKTARDELNAGSDAKKLVLRSSEKLPRIASGITLDDFGGRSDALGG